ncbi:MAG: 50S ribosomal protein L4 [Pirellulaceae bacterium]|jgi:large subunit ribosomal protein L4|nr:50S ribosomal protein L4 [Pirellulaceae bacterium]MCU0977581.1 50S ribosomal protein L4 [Pirellulaceae bacterium]
MTSLPIYDRAGNQVGSYEIDPAAVAPAVNKQLLHDVVVMYQASRRQGTQKTKSRGEVRGSTKKLYRQKGTGNARAGSRRSGVRRGGGHIHALQPRDYSYRLPRKAVQAATRMAIRSKLDSGNLVCVDQLSFSEPRTKEMAAVLGALKLSGHSTLVATVGYDVNVYKSARNIDKVTVSPVAELNALSVLQPRRMLVTKEALDAICRKVQA